jgi:hypothetical protein
MPRAPPYTPVSLPIGLNTVEVALCAQVPTGCDVRNAATYRNSTPVH